MRVAGGTLVVAVGGACVVVVVGTGVGLVVESVASTPVVGVPLVVLAPPMQLAVLVVIGCRSHQLL